MTLAETKRVLKWAATGMNWGEGEIKRLVMERAKRALECKSDSDIKKFSELFGTITGEQLTMSTVTWVLLNERPVEEFFLQEEELEEEED